MRNAIPKAIAYAKNVRTVENHSFQAWLSEIIKKEDLIAWAQQEESQVRVTNVIPPSRFYEPTKTVSWWRKLSGILP